MFAAANVSVAKGADNRTRAYSLTYLLALAIHVSLV